VIFGEDDPAEGMRGVVKTHAGEVGNKYQPSVGVSELVSADGDDPLGRATSLKEAARRSRKKLSINLSARDP
jgi:hypothetical protein